MRRQSNALGRSLREVDDAALSSRVRPAVIDPNDHVLPRSRGGRNTWLNTVAACGGCNQRKGDRTPAEAGMVLRFDAAVPTWASLTRR